MNIARPILASIVLAVVASQSALAQDPAKWTARHLALRHHKPGHHTTVVTKHHVTKHHVTKHHTVIHHTVKHHTAHQFGH